MYKHFFTVAFFLIFLFVFSQYHPTKEVIVCDENYNCNVTQEYLKIFKKHKQFKLTNHSALSYSYHEEVSFDKTNVFYCQYNGVSVFTYPCLKNKIYYSLHKDFRSEVRKFDSYIKNPQNGYSNKSTADYKIYFLLLLIFIPYLIRLFIRKPKSRD